MLDFGKHITLPKHIKLIDSLLTQFWYHSILTIILLSLFQELKQGYLAMRHAELVAKNVRLLLEGASEKKLAVYKPGRPLAFVSLGKKEAIAQVNCFTLSGCLPGFIKSGDLFVGRTRKTYGLKPYLT